MCKCCRNFDCCCIETCECDLRGEGCARVGKWCLGISCFSGIVLAIVLPIVSFQVVQPTEVAFAYNTNTLSVQDNTLYSNGRYFIGVSTTFIKF